MNTVELVEVRFSNKRVVWCCMKDGELFVDGKLWPGGETSAFLCAACDGVGTIIVKNKKTLFPVSWVRNEYVHLKSTQLKDFDKTVESLKKSCMKYKRNAHAPSPAA